MRNPGVHWSEGMFLKPHHFQAAERHRDETTALNMEYCSAYCYGLQHVSISSEALANGILEFGSLRARWKDGTVIAQGAEHAERVELQERVSPEKVGIEPFTAYLALPQLHDNQSNVAGQDGGVRERYIKSAQLLADDSGGNHQEIELRELNYRILFSHDERGGYELLPLARLVMSQELGHYVVDSDYFPPSLTMQAWPELAAISREIFDVIARRAQELKKSIQQRNITFSSQSEGDLEKIFLLHTLNAAYGELSCLTFASGVHPLTAYTALCRIVGSCSVFGPSLSVGAVPQYDHEDLATIFKWALAQIRELIFAVKEEECEQRYFRGSGRGMRVELEPEWFGGEWDLYIGMDPINASREEWARILKGFKIDWRWGSADQVEAYYSKKMEGISFRAARQLPAGLPRRGNWLFFLVKQEGDGWQCVQAAHNMAIRINTEQIVDTQALEDSDRIRLSVDGKVYGMKFAVFAVRKRM